MEEQPHSLLCGLGHWRPGWLQKFNSTKGFMIVYGLLGTTQAMSYIYFVATLTTLEKRFKISGNTEGIMMSGNEISQILLSLILTYYGGQRNRPLWIAWGVTFSGLSCYILAMLHLLYGPGDEALSLTMEYSHSALANSSLTFDQSSLCVRGEKTASKCEEGDFSNIPALLIFLSQFVLGIGTTLFYALGQTYMDDNSKKSNTPMLLGMTMSLRTIGPAFGFIVGYGCLKLYIAPTLTPLITNKDPRWLGAWWLGWLILGTIMILFSVLIAMFPKKLAAQSGEEKSPELLRTELRNNSFSREKLYDNVKRENLPTLKEFPAALKRLLINKLLLANIWSAVFYILGGSVYFTFINKYLEIQFNQTAAGGNIIIGITAVLSVSTGLLISGAVISKFKPRPTYLLGWNVIVGICFILGEISYIFLSCEDSTMVGFRDMNHGRLDVINACNIGCGCGSVKFNPVCLEKAELTFYTACHAGCMTANYSDGNITYSGCSCIPTYAYSTTDFPTFDEKEELVLKTGACKSNCYDNFIIFNVISVVMHSLGSSGRIGNILVNYRAVDSKDKSFAQGLALLMVSLFAFIPGPIMFGSIIDSTCLIWDETCGKKGNCWLYDKDNFRFLINIVAAGFTLFGVLFDVLVCYLGRNLKLYEDDNEGTNKTSEILQIDDVNSPVER